MFAKRIRAAAIGAAFGVVGLFGSVAPAQAAVYAGHWDPAFGAPFLDLSWSALAYFFIPDTCLGDGVHTSCTGFDVQSGNVTFSQTSNPANTDVEALPSSFLLDSFTMEGGVLTAVEGQFGRVKPTASYAGSGNYAFTLSLFGDGSDALLSYIAPANGTVVCSMPPDTACGVSSNVAPLYGGQFVLVPAVPEPGTYALVFAGLGMMGFMARRRKF